MCVVAKHQFQDRKILGNELSLIFGR